MQDAIYNQIQVATNIANKPYESYDMPRVAELSPLQQQAYQNVQANQGAWKGELDKASSGYGRISEGTAGVSGAQPYATGATDLLKNIDYKAGVNALSPYVSQATGMSGVTAAQPYIDESSGMARQAGTATTADALRAAQAQYLQPQMASQMLAAGQRGFGTAEQTTAQALSERALAAADPYLRAAGQSTAAGVGQFMNPYQQGVLDVIAKQGARNLTENLLPGVSDAFIRAGQFGSTRMGEFGSRALRDTQEAILDRQAQAAQAGYSQALQAQQADLARQAQLAGTVGSISGADLSRILQGGGQQGSLAAQQMSAAQAQQQMGLSASQAEQAAAQADLARKLQASQQMGNLGQTMGGLTQAQQNILLSGGKALSDAQAQATAQQLSGAGQYANLAGTMGNLSGADANRQLSALQAMQSAAQQRQNQLGVDTAALEAAGQAMQQQQQRQLDASYQQFMDEQNYPKQQMDWLNTQIRGMAPITPQSTTQSGTTTGATYSASPLSQLASGV
jgi:hypothetical protein